MDPMTDMEKQVERRMPFMEFLTQGYAHIDGIVIGFALMIEYIDEDGQRDIHKITSDAGGHPLPFYVVQGIANALECMDDFDEFVEDDDE